MYGHCFHPSSKRSGSDSVPLVDPLVNPDYRIFQELGNKSYDQQYQKNRKNPRDCPVIVERKYKCLFDGWSNV